MKRIKDKKAKEKRKKEKMGNFCVLYLWSSKKPQGSTKINDLSFLYVNIPLFITIIIIIIYVAWYIF
jgi:hypothetical protein